MNATQMKQLYFGVLEKLFNKSHLLLSFFVQSGKEKLLLDTRLIPTNERIINYNFFSLLH